MAFNLGIGAPAACVMHCMVDDTTPHDHHGSGHGQTANHGMHGHHHPELIAVQFLPSDTPIFQAAGASTDVPWFCHHHGGEPVAIFPAVIALPTTVGISLIIIENIGLPTPTWASWHRLTPLRPPIPASAS